MKFSFVLLSCFALTFAAPIFNPNELSQRSLDDVEEFDAVLERRTGPFAATNAQQRTNAINMIKDARRQGHIATAASPGGQRTVMANRQFHIDRQTPTNAHGSHKVAIQNNRGGNPSTVGQVAVHSVNGHRPSTRLVAKKLQYSVKTGREAHARPSARKLQNIANNNAARQRKAARNQRNHANGQQRARQGNFRKGKK